MIPAIETDWLSKKSCFAGASLYAKFNPPATTPFWSAPDDIPLDSTVTFWLGAQVIGVISKCAANGSAGLASSPDDPRLSRAGLLAIARFAGSGLAARVEEA